MGPQKCVVFLSPRQSRGFPFRKNSGGFFLSEKKSSVCVCVWGGGPFINTDLWVFHSAKQNSVVFILSARQSSGFSFQQNRVVGFFFSVKPSRRLSLSARQSRPSGFFFSAKQNSGFSLSARQSSGFFSKTEW